MIYKKEKYLKILKLELSHLIEDISSVIAYEKELHDKLEHTNFVYLENLVVLKDEIMGVSGIIGQIENIANESTDENLKTNLENSILEFVKKRGYPMAVYDMFLNKLKKIDGLYNLC
ncbi:MAG: hypothetical protein JXR48_06375 [Candidatus Delongbacteria bacterium]|nr:hypothetical protein [Candidatus Delongbacteria bacterium]